MAQTDTIFALATGQLPSGIAIMRISGPGARHALERLCGRTPEPRKAQYGRIGLAGEMLDTGLAFLFPGPGSATGEDCAELHVHGSRAVVRGLAEALATVPGLRPAEPGEFTRRAFLNGRMDLTGVESLSDLIASETEQQRRFALAGMSGAIRDLCEGWRSEVQDLRVRVEADLDFSDQEDVGDEHDDLRPAITSLAGRIEATLSSARAAEIVRDGFRVAIVGAPNSGKSSLLNALARREVAIVTPIAGTTRDLIEVSLDLAGFRVVLMDTAGLRETDDVIERIGIARARQAAKDAHLVLMLEDGSDPAGIEPVESVDVILVATKCDLGDRRTGRRGLPVSSVSGEGIGRLIAAIEQRLVERAGEVSGLIPLRERHLHHMRGAVRALLAASDAPARELQAEELRLAAMELGFIVGVGDTEALLGDIFARFCIGK